MLSVMGAFAEFERALIRERQREGIVLVQAARCLPGTKEIAEQRTNCRVETASCGRRPKNLGGP